MQSFKAPLNYFRLEKILGRAGQSLIWALYQLKVTSVLNVKAFTWEQGYEPDVGSIFLYGQGGSYDFDDPKLGEIYIHNGTIMNIEAVDSSLLSYASENYFN